MWPGEAWAYRSSGAGVDLFYIHTDHLNTPRRISRPSDNAIVWRWDADPFGGAAANEDPDGDRALFVYNLRFPGQYLDAETGLHYNYFRDYEPATGRYVQSDPIGPNGGINTYVYAMSRPLMYVDPQGLDAVAVPWPGTVPGVRPFPGWLRPPNPWLFPLWLRPLGDSDLGYCTTPSDSDKDEQCYEKCKHLLPSPSGRSAGLRV